MMTRRTRAHDDRLQRPPHTASAVQQPRPGHRGRPLRAVLLALLFLVPAATVPHMLSAEVLSPPPVPMDPWVETGATPAATATAAATPTATPTPEPGTEGASVAARAFPAGYGWIGMERYIPESDDPLFAWDFDLGYHVVLYGGDRVTVSGLGRLLYQNEGVPGRRFGIDPSAIVTDLHLRVRFPTLPLNPAVWYRHDCKHDIARKRSDLIHDVLRISVEERVHLRGNRRAGDRGREGVPGARMSTLIRLDLEYDLPLIFQDYESNANVATAHLTLRPELELGRSRPVLFAEARGSVLVDDPESDFATAGRARLDGLVRAGISWPERTRGATLYAQLERITDPWRLPPVESEPVLLYSFGLMLAGTGY